MEFGKISLTTDPKHYCEIGFQGLVVIRDDKLLYLSRSDELNTHSDLFVSCIPEDINIKCKNDIGEYLIGDIVDASNSSSCSICIVHEKKSQITTIPKPCSHFYSLRRLAATTLSYSTILNPSSFSGHASTICSGTFPDLQIPWHSISSGVIDLSTVSSCTLSINSISVQSSTSVNVSGAYEIMPFTSSTSTDLFLLQDLSAGQNLLITYSDNSLSSKISIGSLTSQQTQIYSWYNNGRDNQFPTANLPYQPTVSLPLVFSSTVDFSFGSNLVSSASQKWFDAQSIWDMDVGSALGLSSPSIMNMCRISFASMSYRRSSLSLIVPSTITGQYIKFANIEPFANVNGVSRISLSHKPSLVASQFPILQSALSVSYIAYPVSVSVPYIESAVQLPIKAYTLLQRSLDNSIVDILELHPWVRRVGLPTFTFSTHEGFYRKSLKGRGAKFKSGFDTGIYSNANLIYDSGASDVLDGPLHSALRTRIGRLTDDSPDSSRLNSNDLSSLRGIYDNSSGTNSQATQQTSLLRRVIRGNQGLGMISFDIENEAIVSAWIEHESTSTPSTSSFTLQLGLIDNPFSSELGSSSFNLTFDATVTDDLESVSLQNFGFNSSNIPVSKISKIFLDITPAISNFLVSIKVSPTQHAEKVVEYLDFTVYNTALPAGTFPLTSQETAFSSGRSPSPQRVASLLPSTSQPQDIKLASYSTQCASDTSSSSPCLILLSRPFSFMYDPIYIIPSPFSSLDILSNYLVPDTTPSLPEICEVPATSVIFMSLLSSSLFSNSQTAQSLIAPANTLILTPHAGAIATVIFFPMSPSSDVSISTYTLLQQHISLPPLYYVLPESIPSNFVPAVSLFSPRATSLSIPSTGGIAILIPLASLSSSTIMTSPMHVPQVNTFIDPSAPPNLLFYPLSSLPEPLLSSNSEYFDLIASFSCAVGFETMAPSTLTLLSPSSTSSDILSLLPSSFSSLSTCDDIDECLLSPCNGPLTVCSNTFGSFTCDCAAGYTSTIYGCQPISCSSLSTSAASPTTAMVPPYLVNSADVTNVNINDKVEVVCPENFLFRSNFKDTSTFTCLQTFYEGRYITGWFESSVSVLSPVIMHVTSLPTACVTTCPDSFGSQITFPSLTAVSNRMAGVVLQIDPSNLTCPDGETASDSSGMQASCGSASESPSWSFEDSSGSPLSSLCRAIEVCVDEGYKCTFDNSDCVPTAGLEFTCNCISGFTLIDSLCDRNECVLGIHNCLSGASCSDTNGSFTCECPSGFLGDGVTFCELPLCKDGIQNGDEEGIDCGGSLCDPCPVTCLSDEVTVSSFSATSNGVSLHASACVSPSSLLPTGILACPPTLPPLLLNSSPISLTLFDFFEEPSPLLYLSSDPTIIMPIFSLMSVAEDESKEQVASSSLLECTDNSTTCLTFLSEQSGIFELHVEVVSPATSLWSTLLAGNPLATQLDVYTSCLIRRIVFIGDIDSQTEESNECSLGLHICTPDISVCEDKTLSESDNRGFNCKCLTEGDYDYSSASCQINAPEYPCQSVPTSSVSITCIGTGGICGDGGETCTCPPPLLLSAYGPYCLTSQEQSAIQLDISNHQNILADSFLQLETEWMASSTPSLDSPSDAWLSFNSTFSEISLPYLKRILGTSGSSSEYCSSYVSTPFNDDCFSAMFLKNKLNSDVHTFASLFSTLLNHFYSHPVYSEEQTIENGGVLMISPFSLLSSSLPPVNLIVNDSFGSISHLLAISPTSAISIFDGVINVLCSANQSSEILSSATNKTIDYNALCQNSLITLKDMRNSSDSNVWTNSVTYLAVAWQESLLDKIINPSKSTNSLPLITYIPAYPHSLSSNSQNTRRLSTSWENLKNGSFWPHSSVSNLSNNNSYSIVGIIAVAFGVWVLIVISISICVDFYILDAEIRSFIFALCSSSLQQWDFQSKSLFTNKIETDYGSVEINKREKNISKGKNTQFSNVANPPIKSLPVDLLADALLVLKPLISPQSSLLLIFLRAHPISAPFIYFTEKSFSVRAYSSVLFLSTLLITTALGSSFFIQNDFYTADESSSFVISPVLHAPCALWIFIIIMPTLIPYFIHSIIFKKLYEQDSRIRMHSLTDNMKTQSFPPSLSIENGLFEMEMNVGEGNYFLRKDNLFYLVVSLMMSILSIFLLLPTFEDKFMQDAILFVLLHWMITFPVLISVCILCILRLLRKNTKVTGQINESVNAFVGIAVQNWMFNVIAEWLLGWLGGKADIWWEVLKQKLLNRKKLSHENFEWWQACLIFQLQSVLGFGGGFYIKNQSNSFTTKC